MALCPPKCSQCDTIDFTNLHNNVTEPTQNYFISQDLMASPIFRTHIVLFLEQIDFQQMNGLEMNESVMM